MPLCLSRGGGGVRRESGLWFGHERSVSGFSVVIALSEEEWPQVCGARPVSAGRSRVAWVTVCCPLQIPMFTQGWRCSSRTHSYS